MSDDGAEVRKLLRQQAAIARFGSFALREDDLQKVLTEVARVCAESLGVPFAKVCRYRAAENDLLIEAGHGWKPGSSVRSYAAIRVRRKACRSPRNRPAKGLVPEEAHARLIATKRDDARFRPLLRFNLLPSPSGCSPLGLSLSVAPAFCPQISLRLFGTCLLSLLFHRRPQFLHRLDSRFRFRRSSPFGHLYRRLC
jgi:hypothetical protein